MSTGSVKPRISISLHGMPDDFEDEPAMSRSVELEDSEGDGFKASNKTTEEILARGIFKSRT
jgi:hypothetical protein